MNPDKTTGIWTHPCFAGHDPGPGHPEAPARIQAVLKGLENDICGRLPRFDAPLASRAEVLRAHDEAYVDALEGAFGETADEAYVALDADTVISAGSRQAAYRAAGAACDACDAVMEGRIANAFCAVRPPGHHAEKDRAMGFCLFNNAGIAAMHLLRRHGLSRVAILDFDVHHGNGSQHLAEREAGLFYGSSHQYPFYPGTGAAHEVGPRRNLVNAPLPAGAGREEFRHAWERGIFPALAEFSPEFVIISAGFDAHRADPLGGLRLTEEDFALVTRGILRLAAQGAAGRVVSLLEGGYDLDALALCARAHVAALGGVSL